MPKHPRSVEGIVRNIQMRRKGILKALTTDIDAFFQENDPKRENLCLYGEPDGSWKLDLPAEEVPPDLPEPVLGINFARDGMNRKDWVALIAVHSDAWLMAVAIYYGATLENGERLKMFKKLNPAGAPTLYRQVKNYPHPPFITDEPPNKKKKQLATTSEPPLAKSCTGLKAAAEAEAERCPPSKPGDGAQPLPGQEAEQQGAGVGEPEVDVDALVHALQTLAPKVPK